MGTEPSRGRPCAAFCSVGRQPEAELSVSSASIMGFLGGCTARTLSRMMANGMPLPTLNCTHDRSRQASVQQVCEDCLASFSAMRAYMAPPRLTKVALPDLRDRDPAVLRIARCGDVPDPATHQASKRCAQQESGHQPRGVCV